MAEAPHPQPINGKPDESQPVRLIITFPGPGKSGATIAQEGLMLPGQLYEAAYLLDLTVHEARAKINAFAPTVVVPFTDPRYPTDYGRR